MESTVTISIGHFMNLMEAETKLNMIKRICDKEDDFGKKEYGILQTKDIRVLLGYGFYKGMNDEN